MKWTLKAETGLMFNAWECASFIKDEGPHRLVICRAVKPGHDLVSYAVSAQIVDISQPNPDRSQGVAAAVEAEVGFESPVGAIISGRVDMNRQFTNEEWESVKENPEPWLALMVLSHELT